MKEFQRICLAHYHEIGLKGHNRSVFEMRLLKNLETLLADFPVVTIHRISGRICVFLREGTDWDTAVAASEVIGRVPGVARVSCGFKCERDLSEMTEAALVALSEAGEFSTFKVAARRNHTDFPTNSMEMNQIIGGALSEACPDKGVRMKNPDVIVGVEVVQNASYVYARSVPGVGGLPVGSSGKIVCLLSSGIDSPVATWKMARRGAVCIGVHFSGRPQTSDASEYLVDEIAQVLERTGCIARVYTVPFGDYQREIALIVPPELRVIMYRRLMFKVAETIARIEHAGALVTGESLGQVASQTLDNIRATDNAVDCPVFRPLIGTDKLEIIGEAQRVGTFDISSQDAPDCCTLFMPRSPETHAKLSVVLEAESALPLEKWIDEIIENIEVRDYVCPGYKPKKLQRHRDKVVSSS
ncbi:MAG: tRNA uracil 4-sulfurtransferase ThiI [Gordonibacter sp.]|nr:tRNA uracil 4-sulfurtransferase ThiI [Gordonibacter sp.]